MNKGLLSNAVVGSRIAAVSVAVAAAATAGLSAPSIASAASPASGHAEVIAQGTVAFGDGSFHWSASEVALTADSATPAGDAAGFVVAAEGVGIFSGASGIPLARITAGEGVFVAAASGATLVTADGAPVRVRRIGVEPGDGENPAASFTPGAGLRDVDLVRDVLASGETLEITDSAAAPAFVVVTSGAVAVSAAATDGIELAAGASDAYDGNFSMTNNGTEAAVVLVAVVGEALQSSGAVVDTTPPPGPTSTQAQQTGAPDADSDGLSDDDEAATLTDPANPDSDGDGLSDGDEVHTYGSDPLQSRTDADHLDDGEEVERGTDPTNPDTDADGCYDSSDDNPLTGDGDCDGDTLSFDQERQLGTDPANPDTDGDGFDDDRDVAPLDPSIWEQGQQNQNQAPPTTN